MIDEIAPTTEPSWPVLISTAMSAAGAVRAPAGDTVLRVLPSYSRPAIVSAVDGKEYVVKGPHLGKATVNEQIVGRLGRHLGAPVPRIGFVDMPEHLVEDIRPHVSGGSAPPRAGLFHALELVPNCSDRQWISYEDQPVNRTSFARLAVLYGWIPAGDRQLIYSNVPPNTVYSVDHGHFFPGGPNWTLASIAAAGPPTFERDLWSLATLGFDDKADALDALQNLTPEMVAEAVAAPPADWSITQDERERIADYLWRRRRQLLAIPR